MILGNILDLLAVNVSLWAFYALPPLPSVRRWSAVREWPVLLLLSTCAGVSLQAVIGVVWDHVIGCQPHGALVVTLLVWLLAALVTCRKPIHRSRKLWRTTPIGLLAAILLFALAMRSVHPLQHAFLGQSDAYIHLTFIKDVIDQGHLRHTGYPPGYHWVMAAPFLICRLDPYLTARYGGAFFGLLLTLAAYVFWLGHRSKDAGWFSAFFVAGFPAFMLLVKTGVGAMANQMGLALLPSFLALYAMPHPEGMRGPAVRLPLLALLAAGLAVSVPLMFLCLLLVIGLDMLSGAASQDNQRTSATPLVVALLLLPALVIAALHFADSGSGVLAATIKSMTGHSPPHPGRASALLFMAADFLKPKRLGLGNGPMNLAGVVLLVGFAWQLIAAIRCHSVRDRLLAWFGLLSAVQTMTGALEFSLYQRAGWNLLLAAAWLGGKIAAAIYERVREFLPARIGVAAAIAVSAVFALIHPPQHRPSLSTAEDEMVAVTRSLAALEAQRSGTRLALSVTPLLQGLSALPAFSKVPLALVLRTTSDSDDYWEIPDAVLPLGSELRILYVRGRKKPHLWAAPGHRYVFFLDREETIPAKALGAFGLINPAQAESYSNWQRSLYKPNRTIRDFIVDLPSDTWEVQWEKLSKNAELALVRQREALVR